MDLRRDIRVIAGTVEKPKGAGRREELKWALTPEVLGFEPDAKQWALLRRDIRRLILNCTRQWGKSTVTAAKAVDRAFTRAGSLVLVLSPTARKSAEFLRKASGFVRRVGMNPRGD